MGRAGQREWGWEAGKEEVREGAWQGGLLQHHSTIIFSMVELAVKQGKSAWLQNTNQKNFVLISAVGI